MTTSMYHMSPLFDTSATIDVKTSMYRMRNLHDAHHSDPVSTEIVCNGSTDESDYEKFIEGRQEELLKRLNKLRQLLSEPIILPSVPSAKKIPSSSHGSKMTVQAVDLAKVGLTQEVVLNVSPLHPPHSLLGLAKLWGGILNVKVTCHTHSTVRTLPKPASDLQEKLAALPSERTPGRLDIRLVWKEVEGDASFIVSPLKSVPISGEVNFLRFLNLCIAGKLSLVEQTLLDDRLDSCHAISVATVTKSELQNHSQNVLSATKSSKWLSGDEPSVLDLAAWSVFTRKSMTPMDSGAKQWFQNCVSLFA